MSILRRLPVALFAVACTPIGVTAPVEEAPEPPAEVLPVEPEPWIAPAAPMQAALERCRIEAPAVLGGLEADLGHALQFAPEALVVAPEAARLDRGFLLPAVEALRTHPHAAPCVAGAAVPAVDSVSAWLTAQAGLAAADSAPGEPRGQALRPGFEEALHALCEACDVPPLEDDLAAALTPVLWALRDVVEARRLRDVDSAPRGPDWWAANGGSGLFDDGERPNPAYPDDRRYLGEGRGPLYATAIALAKVIEEVSWSSFAGRDADFTVDTALGRIAVRGAEDDRYDGTPMLLLVELGGDDRYVGPVATNVDGVHPASVVIDLAGADVYEGEGQGAAHNGVAMLFDLGGDDRYEATRGAQGYAHHGVGVLYDGGGNDTYVAEAGAQGAAQYGLALLFDDGAGDDVYRARVYSQGFAYVGGVGALHDAQGNDTYHCDPSANVTHPAPQTDGEHNANFCQGAGFGFRHGDPAFAMAGGIGILADRAGDDVYEAGVYAQGVGYWQGLGVHLDGAGTDHYRAVWYALGAGVHYGAGVHVDGGDAGDDYAIERHASLGIGHDFGLGVAVDVGGDDTYAMPSLSGGASSCGSVALFYDERGDDTYVSASALTLGVSALPEGCPAEGLHPTVAVMLDGDGHDTYDGSGEEGGRWRSSHPTDIAAVAVGLDAADAPTLPSVGW